MSETEGATSRWVVPLLAAGQAQKEMTHNEALALLDLLAAPAVVAAGVTTPPASPLAGQCWVVGAAPTGAWIGHAGALAGWTAGGWRFAGPREGLTVWSEADGVRATYTGGQWRVGTVAATELTVGGQRVVGARRSAIAAPTGGVTTDAEARTAIGSILAALAGHGLISI